MVWRSYVLVLQQAKKKAPKKYRRSTVLFYGMDTIRVKQNPAGLNSYVLRENNQVSLMIGLILGTSAENTGWLTYMPTKIVINCNLKINNLHT